MIRKIAIIGIGEVGSQLASILLTKENTELNLIDIGDISGRLLDLQHAAEILNNKIYLNDYSRISSSDIIFYCAGYSNKVNESRNTVGKKNKDLIFKVFNNLRLSKKNLIISVTNPVELSSRWIGEITNAQVFGTGTSLDSYRFKYLLKYHYNKHSTLPFVIGEHGKHMIPVWPEFHIENNDTDSLNERLINSAREIRQTEIATKYGISHTCLDIVNRFYSNSLSEIPLSVEINEELKESLLLNSNIHLSLPCIIGKQTIQLNKKHKYLISHLKQLQESAKKIEDIYNKIELK